MPAALNAVMGAIGELLRIPAHLVSLRTGAALMDKRTAVPNAPFPLCAELNAGMAGWR